MFCKEALRRLLIAAIIAGLSLPFCGHTSSEAESLSSNHFGYILDESLDFNASKIDIRDSGTQIGFSHLDESVSASIALGFPFKYYGGTYSEIYVSVNGFLSVGELPPSSFENLRFPSQANPNNLIGVFWDDLTLNTNQGQVYYQTGGTAPHRYLVVQWVNLAQVWESSTDLTFEAVLFENGNIHLNYFTMVGDLTKASVGIEDGDGIDGIEYLYNEPGLSSSFSVGFVYPPDGPRLKAMPVFQSKFLINEVADYPVRILNTGTVADTYNLTHTTEGTGDWGVRYFDETGAELIDTNADTVIDTGAIVLACCRHSSA